MLILVIALGNFSCSTWPILGLPTALAQENTVEQITRIKLAQQHNIIYLGEKHDSPEHHQQQLRLISQLEQQFPGKLAIALEMFQRPAQPILDHYLAEELEEVELQTQTEFATRWGYDWEFYAPVLRLARKQHYPLIALNTPAEITQKVAQTGLGSLAKSDLKYIPPLEELDIGPPEYIAQLKTVYQEHSSHNQGYSLNLDNFVAAQILWDETMAEAIAKYVKAHPQTLIVVLVGQAHILDDYGIPNRVKRRFFGQEFSQTKILLGEAI